MEQNNFIETMVNNFIGGICAFEVNSDSMEITPVYINNGLFRMFGGQKDTVNHIFSHLRTFIIPDDIPSFEQGIRDILADDGTVGFCFRIVDTDGNLIWLQINGNLFSRKDEKNTINVVITDCTEAKMIEDELKRQSNYMQLLMDTDITFDFNCRTDVCRIRYAKVDGIGKEEVIQGYLEKIPTSGIHEEDIKAFAKFITNAMYHARRNSLEFRSNGFTDNSNDYRWYKIDIVSILGKEGYVSHVIGHIIDIHDNKIKELELKARADHDGLTGLMNKKTTEEMIEKAIADCYEQDNMGALIIMDTDNFKSVNDNYGHGVGDHVLETIGKIIKDNFKGMDITGRIGGDEFMVFANNIGSSQNAERLVQRIEERVAHAFDGEDIEGKISMSIGIAMYPNDGDDFQELYAHADKALYFTKNSGKGNYKIYDSDLE